MKILALVAVVTVAGTASARNIEIPAGPTVVVCVENAIPGGVLIQARLFASKMFAATAVRLNFCGAE